MASTNHGTEHARILIAVSGEIMRRGIRDLLASDDRLTVLDGSHLPEEIPEACRELRPDIVITGLHQNGYGTASEAAEVLSKALRANSEAPTIVLVDAASPNDALGAVRAGAKGVLLQDTAGDTLLEAVHQVLAGGNALDERLTGMLFEHIASGPAGAIAQISDRRPPRTPRVSPRELQILGESARGFSRKEIAAALGVTPATVKAHLSQIYRKLDVHDRTSAVLVALREGLLDAA